MCVVLFSSRSNRVTVGLMRSLLAIDQSELGMKSDWRQAERVETS